MAGSGVAFRDHDFVIDTQSGALLGVLDLDGQFDVLDIDVLFGISDLGDQFNASDIEDLSDVSDWDNQFDAWHIDIRFDTLDFGVLGLADSLHLDLDFGNID